MYFDLDDILAESEKFTGSFQADMENVGFLMNGKPTNAITTREKIELPFWLVRQLTYVLLSGTKSLFTVERPEYLSKLATNFYKASPLNADLSVVSHFYKIVEKWCEFIEQPDLVDTVSDMLIKRASKINDFSFNASDMQSRDNVEFLQTLDAFERELLKTASNSYLDYKNWSNSKSK
jgi:GINS complex subunit 3